MNSTVHVCVFPNICLQDMPMCLGKSLPSPAIQRLSSTRLCCVRLKRSQTLIATKKDWRSRVDQRANSIPGGNTAGMGADVLAATKVSKDSMAVRAEQHVSLCVSKFTCSCYTRVPCGPFYLGQSLTYPSSTKCRIKWSKAIYKFQCSLPDATLQVCDLIQPSSQGNDISQDLTATFTPI